MHLPSVVALSAGFATLSFAAPAKTSTHRAFTIPQVNTGAKKVKPVLPVAMANTYAKYGKTASMPVSVKVAASSAVSSGTVNANPQSYDSEYLCSVSIGTPAQTLMLDFDTGSADLWVFSSEQPTTQSSGHKIYTPSSSSSSVHLSGSTWAITYGDGSGANGDVYTDTVTIGGSTFTSQAVEPAQSASASFVSNTAASGLLGLAMSSINTVSPTKQLTFFDNIKSSLPLPVFTANLRKGTAGNYNFGYIDSSEYTGSITYVSVSTSRGFWEFAGNGYAIGSGTFTSASIDGIADTGTTLLYLPAAIVSAYWAQNGGNNSATVGGYIFPCSRTLTDLTIGIGGYKAVVPGSYLNYAPADNQGNCFGGLQPDTGFGFSIFGDVFLKSQFVVFNGASPPTLGFAAKDLSSTYVPPTSAPAATSTTSTTTSSTTTTKPTTSSTTTTTSKSTTTTTTTTSKSTTTTSTTSSTTTTKATTIPTTTTTTTKSTTTSATTTTKSSSSTTSPTSSKTTTTTTSQTTTVKAVPTTTTTKASTTLSTTTTKTSTTTTTSASATSTCYADLINGKRTFTGASGWSMSLTNEMCQSYCNRSGYAYSGTEWSNQCYCSNTAPTVKSTACTMRCAGSSNEICGGSNALSVMYKKL